MEMKTRIRRQSRPTAGSLGTVAESYQDVYLCSVTRHAAKEHSLISVHRISDAHRCSILMHYAGSSTVERFDASELSGKNFP